MIDCYAAKAQYRDPMPCVQHTEELSRSYGTTVSLADEGKIPVDDSGTWYTVQHSIAQ